MAALSYSVWEVFNNFLLIDATDRSKISRDQKRFFIALSLYPLSFFANTPFKVGFLNLSLVLKCTRITLKNFSFRYFIIVILQFSDFILERF